MKTLNGDKLKGTDLIRHRIELTDDKPVNAKQHKLPHNLKKEVDKQVKQMLDKGIIRESDSPFKSPVWIVPKKLDASGERKFRMVIDFRILNDKTIGDQYPLPNILTIFDQVGNAEYYTVLDLAFGFHQIKLCEADAHKTAFATDFGLYEYVKMPFGLKNSPATFQRMIDKALRGLQGVELFVYIDDIVIYAKSLI